MSSAAEMPNESLHEIEVEWGDLDSLGIVFYPRFYAWADAAAHRMFRAAGLPLDKLLTERRLSFGLVAASADFHAPARYADKLVLHTSVAPVKGRSIRVAHRVVRATGGEPVATVRETRVCMDTSEPGRIRAREIPQDIADALRRFESTAVDAPVVGGR